jgi:hypothetical protein
MEKKAFAVGKVMNGRMSIITANGQGFSRPIVRPILTPEPVLVTEVTMNTTTLGEEPLDVMPWVRVWSDRKLVHETPQPKQSLLGHLVQLFKEFI